MLKYIVEKKKFSEIENNVEIPRFQRGLVWDSKRKTEFISSLKEGLPIGVLLFSKKGENQYLVIDGLQRYTTMLDYSRNPFRYIREDEITDSDAMSVILACQKAQKNYDGSIDSAKDAFRKQVRDAIINAIKTGSGKDPFDIGERARDQIYTACSIFIDDKEAVFKQIYRIVKRFFDNSSIKDVEIPIIVFLGNYDELATIYQNLNQQGVKLSKYDVYAATWINHTVIVNDSEFIGLVVKKYEAAKDKSGLDIANFDKNELYRTGELTVFEYAFGLGKALSKKCPLLFGRNQDDSKIEGISFVILSEIFGLTFLEMGKLAEEMVKYKHILDFNYLKNSIVDICEEIQKVLKDYIVSPTKQAGELACHADLQLASYILVLFKLRYDLSISKGLTRRTGTSKIINDIKTYLHKHYLYDILGDQWAGSGNTKLESLLQDPQTCKCVGDIPKSSFEQVIREWLLEGNDKQTANISTETRLFHNYYIRSVATATEIAQGNFDMEHCVPKKILKKYLIDKRIPVAVNSPCNLVFIPQGDNREKQELTYYQKQAQNPTAYTLNNDQLDKYLYPTHSELLFVEAPESITAESYRRFLKDRENTIADRIIKQLYKCK